MPHPDVRNAHPATRPTSGCSTKPRLACRAYDFWELNWQPDARTVWAFCESLKEHKLAEVLFNRLNQALAEMSIELKSGQIIDATFVPEPIQRNGRDNDALIKAGAVPYSRD